MFLPPFNVYIDDLSQQLNMVKGGYVIGSNLINNNSYADDIVLLVPSFSGLRKHLGICVTYALKHGLIYNVKKTEYIVFQPRNKKFTVPGIIINGEKVRKVSSVTYLGLIICDDLCDKADNSRQCRSMCIRANMLHRRLSKCCSQVRKYLFNTFCSSLYTSALRIKISQASVRDSIASRYCSASEMFVRNIVNTCMSVLRTYVYNLRNRLW